MSPYQVIYDEQCEVCQAGVSWLRILDRDKRLITHPIEPDLLSKIHPRLTVDACLRELHVITPDHDIVVGAGAVILLARLFPETRLIGNIAGAPGLRTLSRLLYRFVALNRYSLSKCRGGACRVVNPATVVKRSSLAAFWSCYSLGMFLRLSLSIPDIPGVVVRRDPKQELREKLDYLKWLREQIDAGLREGLPICAVEATCFPWGRRTAWETFVNDQLMRVFSLGHWSRTELVRSFVRHPQDESVLPMVYQARIGRGPNYRPNT
jgi:predicted DCC family thiol-disulfide oxidoreductase YuxK